MEHVQGAAPRGKASVFHSYQDQENVIVCFLVLP